MSFMISKDTSVESMGAAMEEDRRGHWLFCSKDSPFVKWHLNLALEIFTCLLLDDLRVHLDKMKHLDTSMPKINLNQHMELIQVIFK